jgi:hypothetical protein
MTTIEELREVLEHRAGVPDPTGLIEAARTRAAVVRRRRRITAATVVAGLVVAVVAVPVTVARLRTPDPLPAAPGPPRAVSESTVDLDPASGFFVSTRHTRLGLQQLTVRDRVTGARDSGGTVTVTDPGTHHPTWLTSGRRITVGGHRAFLLPSDVETEAVIGWPDRSGAWVQVSQARSHQVLQRLAESVRLGPPREVVYPVRFGWLPDGVRLNSVVATDDPAAPPGFSFIATVGFTATARSSPSNSPQADYGTVAVGATVERRTTGWWKQLVGTKGKPSILGSEPRWRTIGGQRAWYLPRGSKGFANWTANLLIETGKCGVHITLGVPDRISYDDLVRMVAGMTFADCTDPTTWTPPLR